MAVLRTAHPSAIHTFDIGLQHLRDFPGSASYTTYLPPDDPLIGHLHTGGTGAADMLLDQWKPRHDDVALQRVRDQ